MLWWLWFMLNLEFSAYFRCKSEVTKWYVIVQMCESFDRYLFFSSTIFLFSSTFFSSINLQQLTNCTITTYAHALTFCWCIKIFVRTWRYSLELYLQCKILKFVFQSWFHIFFLIWASKNILQASFVFHSCTATSINHLLRLLLINGY